MRTIQILMPSWMKGYKDYSATTIVAQVELKQNLEFITKGLNARVLANTNLLFHILM